MNDPRFSPSKPVSSGASDRLAPDMLQAILVGELETLFQVSPFRWLRHQLIFWGFGLMFLVELAVVPIREAFPAFGWTDVWHQQNSPLRLGFDIAYDLTGLMVLVGCLMALGYRVGSTDKKLRSILIRQQQFFCCLLF